MRVIHSVDIAEQNNKIVAKNLLNMKKCQNCGAEMEQDALFCRECGTALTEQEVTLSEKTIPYINQIWEDHLQTIKDNPENEVRTEIGFLAEHQIYEVKMISESINDLKVSVAFKKTNNNQKKAFERFKTKDYFHDFSQNLADTDNFSGLIDFSGKTEGIESFLKSFIFDVCKRDKEMKEGLGYVIFVNQNSLGRKELNNGEFVLKKGCLGIFVALIVFGGTLIGLL